MSEERLSIVADAMMSMVREYGRIDEEWYRGMFDAVAEIIGGVSSEMNAIAAMADSSFGQFVSEFEAAYTFDKADDLPGFANGACWAIAGIVDAAANRIEARARQEQCVKVVDAHYGIFREIEQNPGIVQNELAKRLGKNKSNMSQILARLESKGLILVSVQGRFHHYYLSSAGKEAFAVVQGSMGDREMKEACRNANFDMSEDLVSALYDISARFASMNERIEMPPLHAWSDRGAVDENANNVAIRLASNRNPAA